MPFLLLLPGGAEPEQLTEIYFDELKEWPELSRLVSLMVGEDYDQYSSTIRLERQMFVEVVRHLRDVFTERSYFEDASFARMHAVKCLPWNKNELDEVLKNYFELSFQLAGDELELTKRLSRARCNAQRDSEAYPIAIVLFRIAWLTMTTEPEIDRLVADLPQKKGIG